MSFELDAISILSIYFSKNMKERTDSCVCLGRCDCCLVSKIRLKFRFFGTSKIRNTVFFILFIDINAFFVDMFCVSLHKSQSILAIIKLQSLI